MTTLYRLEVAGVVSLSLSKTWIITIVTLVLLPKYDESMISNMIQSISIRCAMHDCNYKQFLTGWALLQPLIHGRRTSANLSGRSLHIYSQQVSKIAPKGSKNGRCRLLLPGRGGSFPLSPSSPSFALFRPLFFPPYLLDFFTDVSSTLEPE
jgi:hypothetical protein